MKNKRQPQWPAKVEDISADKPPTIWDVQPDVFFLYQQRKRPELCLYNNT